MLVADAVTGRGLTVVTGDITRLAVDAIVNAANETLLGGGGVDGAIHAAAGPELRAACAALPELTPGTRCRVGEARITRGFRLPSRHVIHTVGPRWRGGVAGEAELLARCYRECLALAAANECASIAFPAISTGAFGYPAAAAARVAVAECLAYLDATPAPIVAIALVAFSSPDARILTQELAAQRREPKNIT